jgi:hypothetical protein
VQAPCTSFHAWHMWLSDVEPPLWLVTSGSKAHAVQLVTAIDLHLGLRWKSVSVAFFTSD